MILLIKIMEDNSDSIKIKSNTESSINNDSKTTVDKEDNTKTNLSKLEEVKIKPKKELPIEKKPFIEFVNEFLLPSLTKEFEERDLVIDNLYLQNTYRPIAGDKCWVICCEIKDTCNFWLSFERDDITSLKSISLCKADQEPSVIESFLIDEKRITLQLIISRILQRLNGQKLLGVN